MVPLKNIQTEVDASFLYNLLAEHEADENVAHVFREMSAIEYGHAVAFAAKNNLKPEEFMGGTFTISNLGSFGIESFSAVINPPQSCILAVGSTRPHAIPIEGDSTGLKWIKQMTVTLSCDHRVVDGAVGARWLKEFKTILENPLLLVV